jgi:ribosomal protein S18
MSKKREELCKEEHFKCMTLSRISTGTKRKKDQNQYSKAIKVARILGLFPFDHRFINNE